VVVAIDTAERGDAMRLAKGMHDKHNLTYPFWVDTDNRAAAAFGVRAFPTNVIIDQQGIVRYYQAGFDGNAIDAALKQLRQNGAQ
jgi:peroxiredoxin